MNNKNIKIFFSVLVAAILLIIYNYFNLTVINIRYSGFFTFISLLITGIFILIFVKEVPAKINLRGNFIKEEVPFKKLSIILSVFAAVCFIYFISSSPIFFAKDYQKLIGTVKTGNYNDTLKEADLNNLPIIDSSLAQSLGDKKLGEERGLGSEYNVGKFSDILYKGRMVAVAPLEYNDIFKWIGSKGTPGYVVVDKVTGKVELVNKINNKNIYLKYVESGYLDKDLLRHTYFKGNMNNYLNITSFELDEEGTPYFIISKYDKTIGINGGEDVVSVLTVNALNGKVNEYLVKDAPNWIENIYPKELVIKQIDDWGYYVKGFFNTLFSQKNIVLSTSGSRRIYNDNKMYHYTGLTSIGSDESTVGFVFINTRNKQTTFYKVTGATEEAAMASAEGKVQDLGYSATFPLPISINKEPTLFITLKDNKGLIKQYSFVNINDYAKVSSDENMETAKVNYIKLLENKQTNTENLTINGIVERIGLNIVDNNVVYYLKLKDNKTIYIGSNLKELTLTKIDDNVEFKVNGDEILSFNNKNIE